LAALALSFALEGSAAAQAMFTASIGNAFGGDAPSTKTTWAASIGGGGAHGIGSELEFSKINNFFETADGVEYGEIMTLMPSIFVAVPIGPVHPYGSFGFGLIRVRTREGEGLLFSNVSDNDFGYSVGGGVTLKFSRYAGIRGDLRHFQVRASRGIGFQRVMVGIVLGG
jgi:hypothetical protein